MNEFFRILHTEASVGWGGQEIRILSEMLGMKGRGHEVALAAPVHSKIYNRASAAGIKVFGINFDKQGLLVTAPALLRVIKSERVQLLNTHSSQGQLVRGHSRKACWRKDHPYQAYFLKIKIRPVY